MRAENSRREAKSALPTDPIIVEDACYSLQPKSSRSQSVLRKPKKPRDRHPWALVLRRLEPGFLFHNVGLVELLIGLHQVNDTFDDADPAS